MLTVFLGKYAIKFRPFYFLFLKNVILSIFSQVIMFILNSMFKKPKKIVIIFGEKILFYQLFFHFIIVKSVFLCGFYGFVFPFLYVLILSDVCSIVAPIYEHNLIIIK